MKTLLKWPGGKEKELPIIREYTPLYTGRYIEPFVGGGAVFFDIKDHKCCINDKSQELINFYRCIKTKDIDFKRNLYLFISEFSSLSNFVDEKHATLLDLYQAKIGLDQFIEKYKESFINIAQNKNEVFISELKKNLGSKIKRSQKLEREVGSISDGDRLDNIESALKSAYYMYIRHLYNRSSEFSLGLQAALFFFIREFCYSSMFRYNAAGEFNVPYGGISYNRKDILRKVDYIFSDEVYQKLSETEVFSLDFEEFLNLQNLTQNDFMFLDPPYDTDFSTYSQNQFGKAEQERLCDCLKKTKAKILLIIKNTDFIFDLYKNDFNVTSFDKKYLVSFMNRNNRDVEHLIIKNY